MKNKYGLLILFTGPSGVGKGTVRGPIMDDKDLKIAFSVSMTTRKPRKGEKDGVDYFFVTKKQFEAAIKKDKLLEHAIYADNYYGTPADYVHKLRSQGKNVFLEIEAQGGLQIINYCKKHKDNKLLSVFVAPESIADLKQRLEERKTEDKETIKRRLKVAAWEIKQSKKYQNIIINKDGKSNKATKQLRSLIVNAMKKHNLW